MNPIPPEILVCAEGRRVCVRVRGRADVSISVGFKELLNALLERNVDHYELELSECRTMDSTFIGVLCGFAQRCAEKCERPEGRPIVFNANDRIRELLESLGVEEMFIFQTGNPVAPGPCTPHPQREDHRDHDQLKATSLEAHETLMALNPENIPKFKELTEFLAEDLKKLRSNT